MLALAHVMACLCVQCAVLQLQLHQQHTSLWTMFDDILVHCTGLGIQPAADKQQMRAAAEVVKVLRTRQVLKVVFRHKHIP